MQISPWSAEVCTGYSRITVISTCTQTDRQQGLCLRILTARGSVPDLTTHLSSPRRTSTKIMHLQSTSQMCGLTLTVASSTSPQPDIKSRYRLLSEQRFADAARGPDAQGSYIRRVSTSPSETVVTLSCGVLSLRGSRTPQPLIGRRGAFAWNGQVFGGVDVAQDENDTYVLFSQLERGQSIDAVLQHVKGPWVERLGTR